MKIAILLIGHLRTWDVCKENFKKTFLNEHDKVDVFLESYYETYRKDYGTRNEKSKCVVENDDQIKERFSGINVVHFSLESQVDTNANQSQINKIKKAYLNFSNYEEKNGEYDLIIKSRPDLFFEDRIIYSNYFSLEESKLILGKGITDHINDTFAMGKPSAMKKYLNRFSLSTESSPFHSVSNIIKHEKLNYEETITHYIVRLPLNEGANHQYVKYCLGKEIPLL